MLFSGILLVSFKSYLCHVMCAFLGQKREYFQLEFKASTSFIIISLKPQSIMDFSQNALKKAAKEKGDFRKKISRRSIVLLNE